MYTDVVDTRLKTFTFGLSLRNDTDSATEPSQTGLADGLLGLGLVSKLRVFSVRREAARSALGWLPLALRAALLGISRTVWSRTSSMMVRRNSLSRG